MHGRPLPIALAIIGPDGPEVVLVFRPWKNLEENAHLGYCKYGNDGANLVRLVFVCMIGLRLVVKDGRKLMQTVCLGCLFVQ